MAIQVLLDFLITSLFIKLVSSAGEQHWAYSSQNDWPKLCKTGVRQSPIDIQTKKASVNISLSLDTKHYDQSFKNFKITNNGHTAQLTIDFLGDELQHPFITGTALEHQSYMFAQLHFHWGTQSGRGSEHTVNGKPSSMEMHLVHYNKKYDNITEAINHSDGLAVIGVLFQITRKENPHLDPIIEGVSSIKIEGGEDFHNIDRFRQSGKIPSLLLKDLLPNDMETFFRYKGSLTTPPCSESVTWLLYHDKTDIGLTQVKSFRELMNANKVILSDTFRNLQSINNRRIETSKLVKDGTGLLSSNSVITQFSIIASLLMLAKF